MEAIVAPVDHIKFDVEKDLELQIGAKPLPFTGMDKSGAAICFFHQSGVCRSGGVCPFRHVRGDRTVVCKHWLRGLCKKGDDCEFLHEFDMSKMPECYFYSRFGTCANRECPFLHIDPESKRKDCPWYDRGFCRHGSSCKNRHVRRVLCVNYLCGLCLDGRNCKFVHPKFDLPGTEGGPIPFKKPVCHHCGELGHVIWKCFKLTEEQKQELNEKSRVQREEEALVYRASVPKAPSPTKILTESQGGGALRNIQNVVCFKCGGKGHYANRCPKGHLAFLSRRPAEDVGGEKSMEH